MMRLFEEEGNNMNKNSTISNKAEQERIYTKEQKSTFEARYCPEIIKQLQGVDIGIIIKSCPAKIIFRKNDNDKNINK